MRLRWCCVALVAIEEQMHVAVNDLIDGQVVFLTSYVITLVDEQFEMLSIYVMCHLCVVQVNQR